MSTESWRFTAGRWFAMLGVLTLWLGPAAGPAGAQAKPEVQEIPDELLVGFTEDTTDADADDAIKGAGGTKLEKVRNLKAHRVRVPAAARDAIEKSLARHKGVEFVERNKLHTVQVTPNDPVFSKEWHLLRIMAPQAWDLTQGTPDIVIAIIDTGVDLKHPDLAGKLVAGYNFYDNNTDPTDIQGHGTLVAGVAAAIGNNGVGVAGVSWNNKIMPLRVGSPTGTASTSTIANAVTYAADHGARVVNLSWAGMAGSSTITAAAKYAVGKGVVVVAAAGNCGCTEATADNDFIISVSATDSSDKLATFSSRGNYIDVAAPGVGLQTTAKGGGYAAASGTSVACPVVVGLVALMLSANPSLTPSDIDALLKINADDLGTGGWDPNFGFGRINAYRSVAAAMGSSAPAPPPPPTPPPADTTPPPDVTSVTATAPSSTQVTVGWANPTTDFAGAVILQRAGSPVADAPAPGQSYAAGQTVGASKVVFVGTGAPFSDTTVAGGTTYFYKIFAFDGAKNYAAGVSTSATPPASTTCANELIIDNLAPARTSSQISFTGSWTTSTSGANPYGVNGSLYSSGAGVDTYTWQTSTLNSVGSCAYQVFVWWTSASTRSTASAYAVSGHVDGSVSKTFNQQTGGGQWQLHGTYTFAAGAKGVVTLTEAASGQASADAVRFVLSTGSTAPPPASPPPPPPPVEVILDDGTTGTSSTGSWCASSAASPFGTKSLYSCGTVLDTYRWTPNLAAAGTYDVYLWWTSHANRSTSVPVTVQHAAGAATTNVNEQINGGKWNYIGRFSFNAGIQGYIEVTDANGQAAADAARWVNVDTTTATIPTQAP